MNAHTFAVIVLIVSTAACHQVTYVAGQVGVVDACSPHSGTFQVTYHPTGDDSCALAGTRDMKVQKSDLPSDFEVSNDLCSFSATFDDGPRKLTVDMTFNDDWTDGVGTVHATGPGGCDDEYDVVVKK